MYRSRRVAIKNFYNKRKLVRDTIDLLRNIGASEGSTIADAMTDRPEDMEVDDVEVCTLQLDNEATRLQDILRRALETPPRPEYPGEFQAVNVPGDGNCFFYAVAKVVDQTDPRTPMEQAGELRRQVANMIRHEIEARQIIEAYMTIGFNAGAMANALDMHATFAGTLERNRRLFNIDRDEFFRKVASEIEENHPRRLRWADHTVYEIVRLHLLRRHRLRLFAASGISPNEIKAPVCSFLAKNPPDSEWDELGIVTHQDFVHFWYVVHQPSGRTRLTYEQARKACGIDRTMSTMPLDNITDNKPSKPRLAKYLALPMPDEDHTPLPDIVDLMTPTPSVPNAAWNRPVPSAPPLPPGTVWDRLVSIDRPWTYCTPVEPSMGTLQLTGCAPARCEPTGARYRNANVMDRRPADRFVVIDVASSCDSFYQCIARALLGENYTQSDVKCLKQRVRHRLGTNTDEAAQRAVVKKYLDAMYNTRLVVVESFSDVCKEVQNHLGDCYTLCILLRVDTNKWKCCGLQSADGTKTVFTPNAARKACAAFLP